MALKSVPNEGVLGAVVLFEALDTDGLRAACQRCASVTTKQLKKLSAHAARKAKTIQQMRGLVQATIDEDESDDSDENESAAKDQVSCRNFAARMIRVCVDVQQPSAKRKRQHGNRMDKAKYATIRQPKRPRVSPDDTNKSDSDAVKKGKSKKSAANSKQTSASSKSNHSESSSAPRATAAASDVDEDVVMADASHEDSRCVCAARFDCVLIAVRWSYTSIPRAVMPNSQLTPQKLWLRCFRT